MQKNCKYNANDLNQNVYNLIKYIYLDLNGKSFGQMISLEVNDDSAHSNPFESNQISNTY
jgi:hypothetical protein